MSHVLTTVLGLSRSKELIEWKSSESADLSEIIFKLISKSVRINQLDKFNIKNNYSKFQGTFSKSKIDNISS